MISISAKELIEFHNNVYIAKNPDKSYVQFDLTSTLSALHPTGPTMNHVNNEDHTTLAIDELIVDAEIYDTLDATENITDDQNVLEFVHSQKLHKQNFLEEIKQKGIKRKQDHNNVSTKVTTPMNY